MNDSGTGYLDIMADPPRPPAPKPPPAPPAPPAPSAGEWAPDDLADLKTGRTMLVGNSMYRRQPSTDPATGRPWAVFQACAPVRESEVRRGTLVKHQRRIDYWQTSAVSDVGRFKVALNAMDPAPLVMTRGVRREVATAFVARLRAGTATPMNGLRADAMAEVLDGSDAPRLRRPPFDASPVIEVIRPLVDELFTDVDTPPGAEFSLGTVRLHRALAGGNVHPDVFWSLVTRHCTGDFGAAGMLADAVVTVEDRWSDGLLASPNVRNRLVLDSGFGVVSSIYPLGDRFFYVDTAIVPDGPSITVIGCSKLLP